MKPAKRVSWVTASDPAVLLVDDIEDNRIMLATRLETCGYSKLSMAPNGRQALEKMRARMARCPSMATKYPEAGSSP